MAQTALAGRGWLAYLPLEDDVKTDREQLQQWCRTPHTEHTTRTFTHAHTHSLARHVLAALSRSTSVRLQDANDTLILFGGARESAQRQKQATCIV